MAADRVTFTDVWTRAVFQCLKAIATSHLLQSPMVEEEREAFPRSTLLRLTDVVHICKVRLCRLLFAALSYKIKHIYPFNFPCFVTLFLSFCTKAYLDLCYRQF